jgi:hypothetical protein
MELSVQGGLLWPFLQRLIDEADPGCRELLVRALADPALESDCVQAILRSSQTTGLWDLVEKRMPSHSSLVHSLAPSEETPHETTILLLRHPSVVVSGAAASSLWMKHAHRVPTALAPDWRHAVLAETEEQAFLQGVFADDSDLAFDWIVMSLAEKRRSARIRDILPDAVSALTMQQRRDLIGLLGDPPSLCWDLARLVVNGDLKMYRTLLASPDARRYWTAPLEAFPGATWQQMALMAVDAGCTAEDIAAVAARELETGVLGTPKASADRVRAAVDELCRSDERELGLIGREMRRLSESAVVVRHPRRA